MRKLTIWSEIKRQLTNTPSFSLNLEEIKKSPVVSDVTATDHLEYIDQEIESALKTYKGRRLIFLLGPFGAGKTTQLHYFIHKRPQSSYTLRSFVKINSLDHAFLHLTNYVSRFGSLILVILFALFLIWILPESGALPFLLITAYFFVKNAGNLVYILHEVCDNLFNHQHRIIILEDLERSSLQSADQWALLANLWRLKRSYLVSLGYSSNDQNAKSIMIEYAQKLGGVIIEVMPSTRLNFSLIKKLDPDFPFSIDHIAATNKGDWLSLFTPREMYMIHEQVILRTLQSKEDKKHQYITVCLELLLSKLGLSRREINYDTQTKAMKPLTENTLSPEQAFFISSFKDSINQ